MAMPDGVEALLRLARAPKAALSRTAYNVTAFNPSAEEIRDVVRPRVPERRRSRSRWTSSGQGIVDSWPADVDDSAARRDWGFLPAYDSAPRILANT